LEACGLKWGENVGYNPLAKERGPRWTCVHRAIGEDPPDRPYGEGRDNGMYLSLPAVRIALHCIPSHPANRISQM
jgi:hypothetical protein